MPITDKRAGVVPLTVVAAKKPGHWIIRAISPFAPEDALRKQVEQIVGVMDPEIEWTTHTYEGWPGYVVYGQGDLPRLGWPTGVYRFDWVFEDCYASEAVRMSPPTAPAT